MPIFPLWKEFVETASEASNAIDNAISRFKYNSFMLDREVEASLDTLPAPTDKIAMNVYRKSDGSIEHRASDASQYLKHLQNLGWSHYQAIVDQLEQLIASLENSDEFLGTESSISRIR